MISLISCLSKSLVYNLVNLKERTWISNVYVPLDDTEGAVHVKYVDGTFGNLCFDLRCNLYSVMFSLLFAYNLIGYLLSSKRPSFTAQKVIFYSAKGCLLSCKR